MSGIRDSFGGELASTDNPVKNGRALDVCIVDIKSSFELPFISYLYIPVSTPNITQTHNYGDMVLNVDDTTGITIGDAITIRDGFRYFQSIVASTTATTITLASPMDYGYDSTYTVDIGEWNMAVNGSTVHKNGYFYSPSTAYCYIHTIKFSILSTSPMDDSLFGSLTALTNGIYLETYSTDQELGNALNLITNNIGFMEQGWEISYSTKAPSGKYGLIGTFKVKETIGNPLIMRPNTQLRLKIRDNLTNLTQFTMTVMGFMVEVEK